MEWLSDPTAWVSLLTLTLLETVLGVDNVIFISILAGRLPEEQQAKARRAGLMAAMVMRILLLFSITWIMQLKTELFSLFGHSITGKDLILIVGGLFLLYKATNEIHDKLEGEEHETKTKTVATFGGVIAQVLLLDMVFSIDSVVTAVGMVKEIGVMVTAVVLSVGIMLLASGSIYKFVNKHPSIKMLALAFLVLIGVTLLAEGFGQHISKGYIYFAMAFSVGVEMLNLRSKAVAVKLREPNL